MQAIRCPKTSVNYQRVLRNIREERTPQIHAAEAVNLTQCRKIKLAHSGARSLFLARSTRRQCVCSADGWGNNTLAAVLPLSENVALCSYLSTSLLFHLMPPRTRVSIQCRLCCFMSSPTHYSAVAWLRHCQGIAKSSETENDTGSVTACNKLTRYSTSRPASCGGTEIDSLHCAIIQRSGASSWPAFPEHLTS